MEVKEEAPRVREELPITKEHQIKLIPNSTINVTHDFTEGEPNTKIYSLKFDKQDKYIAAACENGEVRVYNVKAKKLAYTLKSTKPGVPFSYVRWRPDSD